MDKTRSTLILLATLLLLSGCADQSVPRVTVANTINTDVNSISHSLIWQDIAALLPLADVNVADDLDINAEGTVAWIALANYPVGCAAGEAVSSIGDTLVCVSFAGGTGRTYTSGTIGTIQVNNDNNTISLNFDGNFYSRLNGVVPWVDVNVADNISVDWAGLQSYPAGCGAGQAVQTVGDTLTCVDINSFVGTSSGGGGYRASFVNLGVPTGTATVTHGINSLNVGVHVYDDANIEVMPDEVDIITASQVSVKLASFQPFAGWWKVVVVAGGSAASSSSVNYVNIFTNADLSSGVLAVAHDQNTLSPIVQIYNNNNDLMMPDRVNYTGTNALDVYLNSFIPISGTWRVVVDG